MATQTELEKAYALLMKSADVEVPKLRVQHRELTMQLFQVEARLKVYGKTVEPEKMPNVSDEDKEKVLNALEGGKTLSVKALQKATDIDQVKLGKVRKALIAEGKIKEEKDENNRLQTNISLVEE